MGEKLHNNQKDNYLGGEIKDLKNRKYEKVS